MAKEPEFKKVPFEDDDKRDSDKAFHPIPMNNVKLVPGDWIIPDKLDIEAIRNVEVYDDDVWIVTPPKCGTTWMQELAWLIKNEVDLEKAQSNQFFRVPFIELGSVIPPIAIEKGKEGLKKAGITDLSAYPGPEVPMNEETAVFFMSHSIEFVKRMPRPRLIKTHLPICVLPKDLLHKGKVIYVGRNVKDATVSFYHHLKLDGLKSNFVEFADFFKRGIIFYNPFIPHVLDAWKEKDNPNMFFTTYEEMSKDLRSIALKLIQFLGEDENLIDMEKLLKAVHIETFRGNKYVNKEKEIPPDDKGNSFIRKGKVGDWRNHFDEKMNAEWDPWIEEQLKGSYFKMEFD